MLYQSLGQVEETGLIVDGEDSYGGVGQLASLPGSRDIVVNLPIFCVPLEAILPTYLRFER